MNKFRSLILTALVFAPLAINAAEVQNGKPVSPLSNSVMQADAKPLIHKNERVAIVGDSITEQKQYSRFMELYLTACQPQMEVDCHQFGWGGERAEGFLRRMDADLAGFKPSLVTLCYGMNDGSYKAYELAIGEAYSKPLRTVVDKLKQAGVTVIVGGPGAVDTHFYKKITSPEVYNHNLATLTELAKQIAKDAGMPHADVHEPMITAMAKAKAGLGNEYDVCGRDGFHPNPNGHLVMAYAFLKSMNFDGDLGKITLDTQGPSTGTGGHLVKTFSEGKAVVESTRYPYCFSGDNKSSASAISILPYLPFNAELNRLTLVVRHATAPAMNVTWGAQTKKFSREELERGINLAAEFVPNPFNQAFSQVEAAIVAKQNFETQTIKSTLSNLRALQGSFSQDPEALAALELITKKTGERWLQLNQAVKQNVKPVTHTLTVEAAE